MIHMPVFDFYGIMLAIFLFGCALGIFFGSYIERVEWNKLINEGIIPKPKSKRR